MESPAVSVIIPVWNSGKYFRECLDSVLAQTLRNIEVLIVDDASTDGSGAVADEYAARDSRITVVHQKESTGAGPARNAGMAMAQGEYIAFMDSDDLYPSNDVLETLYNKAVEQNANICGGSLYKIDPEGNILDKKVPHQFFINDGWYNYKDYQYDGGFYRFLYFRIFLKENGLMFPSYRRFQDSIFFVNTMIKSEKFYVVDINSYAYRKNHKNIIWNNDNIKDHINGIYDLLIISKENKLLNLHYLITKNLFDTLKNKLKIFYLLRAIKCLLEVDFSSIKGIGKKLSRKKFFTILLNRMLQGVFYV